MVDLIASCRVLVQLHDLGSVTLAAAALRIPQSVASRRLAALEEHLELPLVDRTARRSTVSEDGRRLVAAARRLVRLADGFVADGRRARGAPRVLGVPEGIDERALVALAVASWHRDVPVATQVLPLAARREALESGALDAAVLPAVPEEATWRVPLGVASARPSGVAALRLAALRPSRVRSAGDSLRGAVLLLLPEDDVPHVGDRLRRAAHRDALHAEAVQVAVTRTAAIAAATARGALVLTSRHEARASSLHWVPLVDPELVRGSVVRASSGTARSAFIAALESEFTRCLVDGSG